MSYAFQWPHHPCAFAAMSLASVTGTALTGLRAAQNTLGVAADNLANQRTKGFRRSRAVFATQPPLEGVGTGTQTAAIDAARPGEAFFSQAGRDIARDLIDLTLASNQFRSNLAVLRTSDDLLESLANLPRQ